MALEGYWRQVPGGHTLRDKSQEGITSNNACSTALCTALTLPPPALGAVGMVRHSPTAAGKARLCCLGEQPLLCPCVLVPPLGTEPPPPQLCSASTVLNLETLG